MEHGGPPDLIRHDSLLRSRTADHGPELEHDLHGSAAIARWDNPGVSPMPPAIVVPIAKAIGLHRKPALWVLRHALAKAARWPGHMRAAVNMPAPCFQGEGLYRAVLTTGAARALQ